MRNRLIAPVVSATTIVAAAGLMLAACLGGPQDPGNPAPAGADALADSANEVWPSGQIPYVVHPSFRASPSHISTVMRRWENGTPVRFIPRRPSDEAYVLIKEGGCTTSDVGQTTIVEADSACLGHELGHALGLTHEHQRPDRDRFVTVSPPWYWFGHGKEQYEIREQRLCRPYDLGSIMHYRVKYIVPKPGLEITQKNNEPSAADLLSVRQLYGAAPCTPPTYEAGP